MSGRLLLEEFERVLDVPEAPIRLRRLVLDLAARGRLSERRPTDASGRDLLAEIESRLTSLRSASPGRKHKTITRIDSDDAPFAIPETWVWTRVRQITRDRGQTTPTADFTYIDVTSIDKDAGRIHAPSVLAASNAPSRARKVVAQGDVLFSCVRPYLLNIAVVEDEIDPPPIASTAFAVLDGLGLVDPHFLWIVLRSPYFVSCVEAKMRGQAYPAINDSEFSQLPIPLPPLEEQQQIVARVQELMALSDQVESAQAERETCRNALSRASLERLTATKSDAADQSVDVEFFLDRLPRQVTVPQHVGPVRQAILDLAVRGRLVPQDAADESSQRLLAQVRQQKLDAGADVTGRDWLARSTELVEESFPPPQGWVWSRIGAAVERVTVGYVGPMTAHYVDSGVPFLRSQNVRPNRFRPEGLIAISPDFHERIRKSALAPGDVVVVRSGNVGTACVVPEEVAEANCSDLVIIKRPLALTPEFLCFYLNSLASTHIEAGSVGMALTHFNTKSVATMPVPIPPLAEQHRIVARVHELMAICDELEAALDSVVMHRSQLLDALLQDALYDSAHP